MSELLAAGRVELICGDCIEAMPLMPDNSLDSCVTDPPYHLVSIVKRFGAKNAAPAKEGTDGAFARASRGFMGKQWDGGDIAFRPETWAEVLRVLKPGAHLVVFGSSRGYHRMACAIEDAGFEIRDSLMWVYGTGFPKSQNVSAFIDKELGFKRTEVIGKSARHGGGIVGAGTSFEMPDNKGAPIFAAVSPQAQEFDGFGTALKPSFEPIVLARKPLSEKTVAANVLRWRTGALNIDGCRVEANGEKTGSNGAVGLSPEKGWNANSMSRDVCREQSTTQGRWPANVVHDGSDEVVGAFPQSNGQQGTVTGDEPTGHGFSGHVYGYGGKAKRKLAVPRGDSGSAARFFYSAKASKADRAGSKHPTVKPIALMQWLTRLVTPPGGVVLDPFAGSGTTGEAALRGGFKATLIEAESEYQDDIRLRIAMAMAGPEERKRMVMKASGKTEPFETAPLAANDNNKNDHGMEKVA